MNEETITKWQWLSCVLIVVAQIADVVTTIMGMEMGAVEKNPVMAVVLDWGYAPFILFKLVLAALLAYVALVTRYIVWIILIMYWYVLVNNVEQLVHLS